MSSWKTVFALGAIGLMASLPAAAQAPAFPASWAGIWQFDSVEKDCVSGTVTATYSDTDSLCTGEPSTFVEDGTVLDRTGTINDTSMNVDCSTMMIEGPCTATFFYSVQATRNGDSVSGTETFSITYSGCAPGPIDECSEVDLTGTRTDPEPADCNTPVLPVSWGRIKATYSTE